MPLHTYLINILGYVIGWYVIVTHGEDQINLPVILGLIIPLTLHFIFVSNAIILDALFLIILFICGAILESIFAHIDVLHYTNYGLSLPKFAPLWVMFLYPLFGTTIRYSLIFLKNHPTKQAAVGFVFAPMIYYGITHLSHTTFFNNMGYTLLFIGTVWAMLLPTLFYLSKSLENLKFFHK